MPARIFRYQIRNEVQGHTLNLVAEHLCGGAYTPGGWMPKATIPSGTTAGIQAESDGFMTGTQGWLKYRLVRNSDQAARGLVYLYWTNPYFGVTYGKQALVGQDIRADCDDDEQAGGSSFAEATGENAPPSDLHLKIRGKYQNGSPTDVDEWGDAYRIALAPVWIFGAAGIWERMEVDVALTSTSVPSLFPAPGTRTRRLESNPMPESLLGTWLGTNVSIRVAEGPRFSYQVHIKDETPGYGLELDTFSYFGREGWTEMLVKNRESVIDLLGNHSTLAIDVNREQAVAAVSAFSTVAVRERASLALNRPRAWERSLQKAALEATASPFLPIVNKATGVATASPFLPIVSKATGEALLISDYTLRPEPAVALQLYRELEDGNLRGYSLNYQRLKSDGSILRNDFLNFDLGVR